jgi:citrate synthase
MDTLRIWAAFPTGTLTKYLWANPERRKGHPATAIAVLRKRPPRYRPQREFALKTCDYTVRVVQLDLQGRQDILLKHGKAKNPWPNVDAHTGVPAVYYGVTIDFYTVFSASSRASESFPDHLDRSLAAARTAQVRHDRCVETKVKARRRSGLDPELAK